MRYRSTTLRLNDSRGSEQYHSHELVNGMPIAVLSIGGRKAIQNCEFRLIQVWRPQDRLRCRATFLPRVLLSHRSRSSQPPIDLALSQLTSGPSFGSYPEMSSLRRWNAWSQAHFLIASRVIVKSLMSRSTSKFLTGRVTR
jgi:hypothetical protein